MSLLGSGVLAVSVGLGAGACTDRNADRAAGEIPTDSGYVTADDGVRLFYRTVGDGPAVIVIPVALYLEQALRPLASAERRLVFYDPRARGRSDAGDRSLITLERQIADVEAIRRSLGIERMALIGWSGLGMEMAVYTIRYPERVTALVQVAPVAARDAPHNARAYLTRRTRIDTLALAALTAAWADGDFDGDEAGYCRALQAVTGPANFADPGRLADVPDVCGFPNEYPDSLGRVFSPLLDSFRGYDWRDEIARVTVPRLVIHGVRDAFPLEGSREWVAPGTNARLLIMDGAGHFPFLERPDVFFAAVEEFLRGEWPQGVEDREPSPP